MNVFPLNDLSVDMQRHVLLFLSPTEDRDTLRALYGTCRIWREHVVSSLLTLRKTCKNRLMQSIF